MSDIEIILLDTSELAEYEAVSKGYRKDVFVKIDEVYYNLNVYDMVRLKQDFDSEIEIYGYYSSEPNIVLTTDASFQTITQTIIKLYQNGYFQSLKSIDREMFEEIKQKN